MTTMTSNGQTGEWTAAALRPTARWVSVTAVDGRTRMESVWAVPAVTVDAVTTTQGPASAAA